MKKLDDLNFRKNILTLMEFKLCRIKTNVLIKLVKIYTANICF